MTYPGFYSTIKEIRILKGIYNQILTSIVAGMKKIFTLCDIPQPRMIHTFLKGLSLVFSQCKFCSL